MTELEVAALVKEACIKAVLQGYESASISGLCHQGAFDVAVDALKSLDLEKLLQGVKSR